MVTYETNQMAVNHEIKSQLARLLATEDLVVEHKKVSTACFNVHTRVLTLPLWEKASNTVYDLLVGHEVGHALFTPDEEVGRGVDFVDIKKLAADVAYTLDGGEVGSLETENFSADGVTVTIKGVSAHPGYAKGKMVNALKIAGKFISMLPADILSPESTDNLHGFIHPVGVTGNAESATVDFIIRDFSDIELKKHEALLESLLKDIMSDHPKATYSFKVKEQYRNMKSMLDNHPKVAEYAAKAILDCGLPLHTKPIRGGTDGARLSFMGLPCPNVFTGEMALHSKHEYVSVQDMQKSLEVLLRLVALWAA
jgi:tripeptide aminopeptidase